MSLLGVILSNGGREGIIHFPVGPLLSLLPLVTGDPEAIAPATPFTLWGVSRLGSRPAALTLAGDPRDHCRKFLHRQTRRAQGRVRMGTERIHNHMNQVALQAAHRIFVASYLCPLHVQRSGPSEGPDACRQCHPDNPLVVGTEPLFALCREAIHVMVQAHLAKMVEEDAYYSLPQGALVPMRLDWAGPMRGLFPASPIPVGEEDEDERPPLGTLQQPTSAPAGWTVGEQPPAA